MAGVRTKPLKSGKYQGWFYDGTGKQKFFTGTRRKTETLRMAERLEDEHRQVRLGYRPPPTTWDHSKHRTFDAIKSEYLAWGNAQGGRNGRPWSKWHSHKRRVHLDWWRDGLNLKTLADTMGILPRVEKCLRELLKMGRAGKTISNYVEALHALCLWCVQRGYLPDDPLKGLVPFDTSPQIKRRALSVDEVQKILDACAPHRRLLLETAFLSGLRVNELRNLSANHLDTARCGLRLDAAWTKDRRDGFQPLPRALVDRLEAYVQSGEVANLYGRFYSRKDAKLKAPKGPLLYVPSTPSRDFDKDLEAAGISKHGPGGKIDFHACRVAFINFAIQEAATVKEAQILARHATPEMTMNVYGRASEEGLSQAVENVGDRLLSRVNHAHSMYREAVGAETESATPCDDKELRLISNGGAEGNRTPDLLNAIQALSQLSYSPHGRLKN